MFDFILSTFQVSSEVAAVCGRAELKRCMQEAAGVWLLLRVLF